MIQSVSHFQILPTKQKNQQIGRYFYLLIVRRNGGIIYLVGGIVRDILLNREFNDIDILLEYDAVIFSQLLQKAHPEQIEILAINEKFKTAKLKFTIHNKSFEVDIASTRSEVYEYPSALPILADTCVPLKKDITRRDFTINSLFYNINKNIRNYNEFIWYF